MNEQVPRQEVPENRNFEQTLLLLTDQRLKEVSGILLRHTSSIKAELSPQEIRVIETLQLQKLWEEAINRIADEEERNVLTKFTTSEPNSQKVEQYLQDHSSELSEEGKFFLQVTTQLREAKEKEANLNNPK